MKKHYNLKYDPAGEIIVTVGATEGIDGAFRTLLNYGDEVLIPEPAFVQYDPCVRMAGGIPVPINLSGDNDFKLTAQQIEEKLTGIICGRRPASCSDQLAKAVRAGFIASKDPNYKSPLDMEDED